MCLRSQMCPDLRSVKHGAVNGMPKKSHFSGCSPLKQHETARIFERALLERNGTEPFRSDASAAPIPRAGKPEKVRNRTEHGISRLPKSRSSELFRAG